MKTAFILFFIILLYSVTAKSQQTFNSLTVKDLTANKLNVSSTTFGSLPCPVMTESERDAIASPVSGNCVYNSDTLSLNFYNGTIWKVAGGGGVNQWIGSVGYNVDDVVIESFKFYVCLVAHTSGTFATDLSGLNWQEVSPFTDTDTIGVNLKAQNGSSVTVQEIQVPNNLSTNTDTDKYLIESGNKNILANPSFEHSTFSTSWTNSAGTFTQETSVLIDGKASAKEVLSSQAMSLTQSSTLYAAQFADGVQGLASVRIKSDIALSVCSINAGTVSTTNCVTTRTDSKWGLYKIPFILGATSNGISIASTGSVTGTVYIDDAFVGAVDLKQDVDQSRIAGESYIAGTTACSLSRASTTIGALTDDADDPGHTVVAGLMGSWQTTDANNITQTVNNLPAGNYEATWCVNTGAATSNRNAMAVYDGTTQSPGFVTNDVGSGGGQYIGECVNGFFYYTSSGNRSFQLYGAASSSTWNVSNVAGFTGAQGATFRLKYHGSSSVYSAQNADTDWASCGHTTSDFTGFGTVTAIETQCKRDGGDLLMKGKFTSGTSTAVEARLALKLNNLALTSKGVSVIPTIQLAGDMTGTNFAGTLFKWQTLIEPSSTYITFGIQNSTQAGLTKANGTVVDSSGSLKTFSLNARIPINGWENSNVIIGTFNEVVTSPGISKPKTCHYAFGGASATLSAPTSCAASPCIEIYDACGAFTAPPRTATGDYSIVIANGTYTASSFLKCSFQCASSGGSRNCNNYTNTSMMTSNASGGATITLISTNQSGTAADAYVTMDCQGQAP